MGEPARSLGLGLEEFWAFEGEPDTRYELFGGEILAMNQPTIRHAALQMSLGRELLRALDGRCEVLGPIGVYCEATGEAFGPDVVVICEPAAYDKVRGRALINPSAIFEILSPSTSRIDTHDKLPAYKTIASLSEYVLISQKKKLIQVHRRVKGGWVMDPLSSGSFRVCAAEISVDAVYERIDKSPLLTG
ncbi:MAG: Uma2 family endonuclease [Labilithrix sp.]|nr:Uma2 family endonuclease [Labilithrix sp.]MCW5812309.1 Uma2 family endonuclease [Labilithrix sp.]